LEGGHVVTEAKTLKLFGEEDLKTRFYLIRDTAYPVGFVGKPYDNGMSKNLGVLYLFDNQQDAQKYLQDFRAHLRAHRDSGQFEIVSSDNYGGIMRILQMTSDTFPLVTLNPGWSKLCVGTSIERFVYRQSALEAGVPLDEI
jgi:hypothetical protein